MDIDKLFNITDADRELYNIYSRLSLIQLLDMECSDPVCRVVKFERLNDKGGASKFAAMTIGGLLPILSSFPTFDEGLAFIESFKPGFRYSKYFTKFAESHIKVVVYDKLSLYKLGDWEYSRSVNTYGNLYSEIWNYRKELHNDNGPAYIIYFNNGNVKRKTYYKNGLEHNENGPSTIEYYENRNIRYVSYQINGKFHRIDGSAIIEYFDNNKPEEEVYYINGVLTRDDGPARIQYYPTGDIWKEHYIVNGKLDRSNGPAVIEYYDYENGILAQAQFYKNGYLDNGEEPAVITYDTNGDIIGERFYKNGILINTRRK
jgi:antitoxin component YwqK of YwqJK toxin-antitoxin module